METSEQHCARVNGRCNRCDNPVPFAFTMAFQPIVDVTARQVIYYEALVRGPNGESAGSILGQVTDDLLYRFDQECRIKAIELASALDMQARLSINFCLTRSTNRKRVFKPRWKPHNGLVGLPSG